MNLSRRDFIKLTGAGLATSCIGALGFGVAGEALAALVRPFKLPLRPRLATPAPTARSPAVSSSIA